MTTIHRPGYVMTLDEHNRPHSLDDEPALIGSDGSRAWFTHGLLHRDFGPAFIHSDGTEVYFTRGVFDEQNDEQRTPERVAAAREAEGRPSVETFRGLLAAAKTERGAALVREPAARHGVELEARKEAA
jgi:hypothetical protein